MAEYVINNIKYKFDASNNPVMVGTEHDYTSKTLSIPSAITVSNIQYNICIIGDGINSVADADVVEIELPNTVEKINNFAFQGLNNFVINFKGNAYPEISQYTFDSSSNVIIDSTIDSSTFDKNNNTSSFNFFNSNLSLFPMILYLPGVDYHVFNTIDRNNPNTLITTVYNTDAEFIQEKRKTFSLPVESIFEKIKTYGQPIGVNVTSNSKLKIYRKYFNKKQQQKIVKNNI